MARPPAKIRPSGAVWQAMQSPARARYSPRATMSSRRSCAPADVASVSRAMTAVGSFTPILSASSVGLAAATERQRVGTLRHGRRVDGRGTRGEPGGDRGDVGFGETARDVLHAVGRLGGACTVAPRAELGADVIRAQPQKTWNARLHACQCGTMATDARRDRTRRVAVHHEGFAVRQNLGIDVAEGRLG